MFLSVFLEIALLILIHHQRQFTPNFSLPDPADIRVLDALDVGDLAQHGGGQAVVLARVGDVQVDLAQEHEVACYSVLSFV